MTVRPILWGRGSSTNVQKVIWTAQELGLDPERRLVAGSYGGNDTAEYLSLNPNGTVPVWQDQEFVIWESQAIMRHLARQHGKLYGSNAQEMALTDQWLDWFATGFWPPVRVLFLEIFRADQRPSNENGGEAALARIRGKLAIVDRSMTSGGFTKCTSISLSQISWTPARTQ